ncbi:MAG: hypothetical protein S4CHLAM102_13670 [Chlamydiia bacterium]|nr:hypothetical protein [Chlamydiia bacterium]
MKESLKTILRIQDLDVQMIRLMRLKKEREGELEQINSLRKDLQNQLVEQKDEIERLRVESELQEKKIAEVSEKMAKYEEKQTSVKKIDEFNALNKEILNCEKEKSAIENALSNIMDKRQSEIEIYDKTKASLEETCENSKEIEKEIFETINRINEEGRTLQTERNTLAVDADETVLKLYERLLRNKKDRVVVPIENRTCSGCHITLTAQHENLVRRGEKLVFCEHCSRIHYWIEQEVDTTTQAPRRRRRKAAPVS